MKKIHTQKQKVLLQMIGVVALAALLAGARRYVLTPDGARRQMENRMSLEKTQVLKELGGLPGGNGDLYFAAAKHAAVLYGLHFELTDGWNWGPCTWVGCSGESPIYVGASRFDLPYRQVSQLWCCGRVDDPEVAFVIVRDIDAVTGRATGEACGTRLDNWVTKNGKRYFVFDAEGEGCRLPYERLEFTALNSAGKKLHRVEVDPETRYLSE